LFIAVNSIDVANTAIRLVSEVDYNCVCNCLFVIISQISTVYRLFECYNISLLKARYLTMLHAQPFSENVVYQNSERTLPLVRNYNVRYFELISV
jgi:hypothetical protein